MNFYVLFFAALVAGSYGHSNPSDAVDKYFLRQRREIPKLWIDVANEINDDVNGASSCISAVETFVAENPEVLALAKRSIAEHILTKRGVISFFKKWLNKLNPIKYFYDCAMFLKDKGVEIYHAIEHPEGIEEEFSEGMQETAQMLSAVYNKSLTSLVSSFDDAKSFLGHPDTIGQSEGNLLHTTIIDVQSNLGSYAANLQMKDTKKVFLDTMRIFPKVGDSLSKLDWSLMSSLKLSTPREKVKRFAGSMHHFHLAHKMMLIMKHASKFYPHFVSKKYPIANDLIAGASCIDFLLNTTEVRYLAPYLTDVGKLHYLEKARSCALFVGDQTTDDQTVKEKSMNLTEKFFKSIQQSVQFLKHLAKYLDNAERPTEHVAGRKKVLRKAVRRIKKFLTKSVSENSKQFLHEAFGDVVLALDKVQKITSEWSLVNKHDRTKETAVVPGVYFKRVNNLMNQFSVLPNIETINSFFSMLGFASQDSEIIPAWF